MTADELRAIRTALGWTQPMAARRLGVKLRAYKYYEAVPPRAHPIPKSIALAMLAHKFNSDIQALIIAEIDEDDPISP